MKRSRNCKSKKLSSKMTTVLSTSSSGSKQGMPSCLASATSFSRSTSSTTAKYCYILPKRQSSSPAKKGKRPMKPSRTCCSHRKTRWPAESSTPKRYWTPSSAKKMINLRIFQPPISELFDYCNILLLLVEILIYLMKSIINQDQLRSLAPMQ